MSAILVSDLSWSVPNGRALFSHLDLTFTSERTGLIGRNGVGKSTLLKLISGDVPLQTGKVSVGGTLGVLRQTVQVSPDETVASLFGVTEALAILHRAETGQATAEDLAEADWTLETRMAEALAHTGLEASADTRLTALSGGQRTRASLAALLFAAPDFLLLDEPTNNLDRDGRQAVLDLLAGWRKGAIIVSHDRELLETVDAIVELTTLGATLYGGNWTAYRARKTVELTAAQADLADAEKRMTDIARSTQMATERKARKDSAGKAKAARGDAPKILLGALKNRSENTGGEQARLAERQRSDAQASATNARERIEVLQSLTITLPPSGLPAAREVLYLDTVTAGYDPDRPVIRDLSLTLTGPERLAITGRNGSGKTTLLALITGQMVPWTGTVRIIKAAAFLDQSVSLLDPALSIRDNFRRLHPEADENTCRAALARFMFRADAALQIAGTLSGGQLLRAGLACVLGGAAPPALLILDEPTNHLDIDAIEAVEAGLRAYDGALIIVSHDEAFLDAVGMTRRLSLPKSAAG